MVSIITDSTADLNKELIQRYGIQVVPLWVHFKDQTFQDGIDIDRNTLFSLVAESGELPKTAAVSVAEFWDVFNTNEESVYIGISSKLSSSVPNAILTSKELLPEHRAHIVDSLNLSTGIGLLAIKAAELREQGYSGEEIAQTINGLIPKIHTSFMIDTMEYLYMGGRCSAMQNLVGSLLKIRPVISVRPDGTLGVKDKIRGSRKKALESMLLDFRNQLPNVDTQRVFITHTGCDDDATFLAEELQKITPIEEICITYAGCVISSHCGPNTIGILFISKE